jgi:benzoyl-CoA-dihydrodiol lyase
MAKLSPAISSFQVHPDTYTHWHLAVDGETASLTMDVNQGEALDGVTDLVLNSYDMSVDIELADAIQRIRFEHPQVKTLVLRSAQDRVFCAGANIRMLAGSWHGFKVNFCKFTNETRLYLEDASEVSGIRSLAALNGTASGGGYELALACDRILLVDDRSSAVSLPEVPLLGVLPGTGGLTRVVDKRRVRRDRADWFSTLAEGIKGRRAVQWKLVDSIAPLSRFNEKVQEEAEALAATSDGGGVNKPNMGIHLPAIDLVETDTGWEGTYVTVTRDTAARTATLTLRTADTMGPTTAEAIREAGASWWIFAAFRELDETLLRLRFNDPETGLWVLRTEGDHEIMNATDTLLDTLKDDWLVHEVRHFIKRVLKRLDVCSRSMFALIDSESCFTGTFFEIALAADRIYMLDDPDGGVSVSLSTMNDGVFPMGNGLSRLQTRFLDDPDAVAAVLDTIGEAVETPDADDLGLVTDAPDDLDWDDTVRIAIEERVSLSPDALTGMEANLRFAGPETLETKIFGRLSAWQNWIFQRPNAVGERGALTLYGHPERPAFDWRRT